MGINRHVVKSTFVSALGGLLFGFDTAVIAGTTHQLTQVIHLTPYLLGLTVSSALWGTVAGAMTAGYPGQKIGRRDSLRMMAVFYVISALGCAFAWSWGSLLVFRIIGGLGIGGSSVLAPMYIAELVAAEVARPSGRFLPDQHRSRHPGGVPVQLPDRPDELRRQRMALDAGHCGVAGGAVPVDAVLHPTQPALAGHEGPRCRSARGPAS